MKPDFHDAATRRVIQKLPDELFIRIGQALEAGGCPEPGHTARFLKACMAAGANPNNIEMEAKLRGVEKKQFHESSIEAECAKQGVRPIDSATLSGRFKRTNLRVFHARLAKFLKIDIMAARRLALPDGKVLAIIDTTVKQSTGRPPKKGTKVPKHARRCHLTRVTSDNKKYRYGIGFIVGVITWTSKGRQVTCPFMFRVQLAGEHLTTAVMQARAAHEFLTPFKGIIAAVLFDRGYDDHGLRNLMAALGWTTVVRLRLGADGARYFIDKEGQQCDLRDIVSKVAAAGPYKKRIGHFQGEREGFRVAEKTIRGRILDDKHVPGEESRLRLSVAVDFVDGKPVPDYKRTCVVVARGQKDLFRLAGLYFQRWRVETFLEGLGDAAPKPRAKTIMAEVIQYLTLVFCTTLGLLLQLIIRIRSLEGKFLGEPIARFSAATLWRWALGVKRFEDPTD